MHGVNFVKNPKGKWYWKVPREGPDVLPLNRFDTYDEAKIDFMYFRSDLAKEWIEDLAASQADRSASELIIETKREKIHGAAPLAPRSGNRPDLPGALHLCDATVNPPPSASE